MQHTRPQVCWLARFAQLLALVTFGHGALSPIASAQEIIPPIVRTLPPPGIELPVDEKAKLTAAVGEFRAKYDAAMKELGIASKRVDWKMRVINGLNDVPLLGGLQSMPLLPIPPRVAVSPIAKEAERATSALLATTDVEVFLKAAEYAVENGEIFDLKELPSVYRVIAEGQRRLDELTSGKSPYSWQTQRGLVVRGFRSAIDGSVQPYGVVIPESLQSATKDHPVPVYVWLHGRGDKQTDVQFIAQRMTKAHEFAPTNGIVIHPFGRYCNAFKYAGETDVFESLAHANQAYAELLQPPPSALNGAYYSPPVVLAGFSMGGAGAWHLGAHYPGLWHAVSPGAGFAETARYQNLTPDKYPPWYVQQLWGLYDVPAYVRNLFNRPVIAYSGELDKQIQAARVMEEAFAKQGQKLEHRIGPGMEHKYHPEVLKQLVADLSKIAVEPPKFQSKLSLQTRTLRYASYPAQPFAAGPESLLFSAFAIGQLDRQGHEGRVDVFMIQEGGREGPKFNNSLGNAPLGHIDQIMTRGVRTLFLNVAFEKGETCKLRIDGQELELKSSPSFLNLFPGSFELAKGEQGWRVVTNDNESILNDSLVAKVPGLQGPIDDAFYDPFLVVVPSGKSKHPEVERWVQFELAHFKDRWRRLFRGDVRVKKDTELTKEDHENYHLIAWGDADSNDLIRKTLDKLPLKWNAESLSIGDEKYAAASHVPVMIYPNPLQSEVGRRYIVLNSGPTFREAHDRSNSLQTPRLPDWAIVDLSVLPSAEAPGRIADAGFFDEAWKYQARRD